MASPFKGSHLRTALPEEPEVVVRELVHSFNLPHVQREVGLGSLRNAGLL